MTARHTYRRNGLLPQFIRHLAQLLGLQLPQVVPPGSGLANS